MCAVHAIDILLIEVIEFIFFGPIFLFKYVGLAFLFWLSSFVHNENDDLGHKMKITIATVQAYLFFQHLCIFFLFAIKNLP